MFKYILNVMRKVIRCMVQNAETDLEQKQKMELIKWRFVPPARTATSPALGSPPRRRGTWTVGLLQPLIRTFSVLIFLKHRDTHNFLIGIY